MLAAGEYADGRRLVRPARQEKNKQEYLRRVMTAFDEGPARPIRLACEHFPHLCREIELVPEAPPAYSEAEPAWKCNAQLRGEIAY